jgi:hypothetical protein
MDGFVNVKKENMSLFLLDDPILSQVDESTTVDKHEQLDFIIRF